MHRYRQAAKAAALYDSAQHTTTGPCQHCVNALELLDMIGVLEEDRTVTPDPTGDAAKLHDSVMVASIQAASGSNPFAQGRFAANSHAPYRPGQCETTPPGLRQFIADTIELAKAPPKPPKVAKPKPKPKPKPGTTRRGRPRTPAADRGLVPPTTDTTCGTLTGRSRHARRGEDLCDPCRDEFNRYQTARRRLVPEKDRKRAARAPCGTPHGAKSHKARGEEPCDRCWEAKRAKARDYWHALPQEKRQVINQRRTARKAELKAQADAEPRAS